MDRLYAPWRSLYIKKNRDKSTECPFCVAVASSDDSAHFVLWRSPEVLVLMNLYPYNTGHLLVISAGHCGSLEGLTPLERAAMMEAVSVWTDVLRAEFGCQGFNIGLNLGVVSGGSIPDHLHMHIVPRWQGDTNFLVTVSDIKLISVELEAVYARLLKRWASKNEAMSQAHSLA